MKEILDKWLEEYNIHDARWWRFDNKRDYAIDCNDISLNRRMQNACEKEQAYMEGMIYVLGLMGFGVVYEDGENKIVKGGA